MWSCCTLEKKSENNSILQVVGLHFYTWYILAGNNPAVGCLHFLIVLQYPPISKLYANYLMLPKKMGYGLCLWCLTSLTIVQLYSGGQFYCLGTPSTRRKPLYRSQSIDKLFHIMYRVHLAMGGIRTHNYSDNISSDCVVIPTTICSQPRRQSYLIIYVQCI